MVHAWVQVESTKWGRLLMANAWPAYVFALLLGFRVRALIAQGGDAADPDPIHRWSLLAQQATTIVFLLLVVALFLVRRPLMGPHATWQGAVAGLGGTFILDVVGFLPVSVETSTAALVASSLVIVAGTLFTIGSLAALGRCFGIFPEVRGLVTRGPYRWVRHPVYFGELTSALGMFIAQPHPLILALYFVFLGLQLWRVRLEEAALASIFPTQYAAYAARTGQLFPRWP